MIQVLFLPDKCLIFYRLLCDSILNCEKMHYQNKLFWNESFLIIRNIIGGVDYKGVREIMKVILIHTKLYLHNNEN